MDRKIWILSLLLFLCENIKIWKLKTEDRIENGFPLSESDMALKSYNYTVTPSKSERDFTW